MKHPSIVAIMSMFMHNKIYATVVLIDGMIDSLKGTIRANFNPIRTDVNLTEMAKFVVATNLDRDVLRYTYACDHSLCEFESKLGADELHDHIYVHAVYHDLGSW